MKNFTKNDRSFTCLNCGHEVPALKTSSRDHCNMCLHSLHVDINPGDRANPCRGTLVPVSVRTNSKKGYVIEYLCSSCGKTHNNKSAPDDNFEALLKISSRNSR